MIQEFRRHLKLMGNSFEFTVVESDERLLNNVLTLASLRCNVLKTY